MTKVQAKTLEKGQRIIQIAPWLPRPGHRAGTVALVHSRHFDIRWDLVRYQTTRAFFSWPDALMSLHLTPGDTFSNQEAASP